MRSGTRLLKRVSGVGSAIFFRSRPSGRVNRPGSPTRWKHLTLPVALLLLAAVIGACSGDAATTTTEPEEREVATTTSTKEPVPETSTTLGPYAGPPVDVRWFIGLGMGGEPEQLLVHEDVVARFNETHPNINLVLEVVDTDVAYEVLAAQIAAGNAPDLVGPVSIRGANPVAGEFLDLDPLIEGFRFDVSRWPEAALDALRDLDGTLTSLPFASYPAMIFYNKTLFDLAGLPYPPAESDQPYGVGTEWEGTWDFDKLTEIAQVLTIDLFGRRATSDNFNRSQTVQWGFVHQWIDDPRAQGSFFGAGTFVAEDGTAQAPDRWVAEWNWYHDAIWELGISPSQEQLDSEALAGNAFASGRVAMASAHLSYTCCITNDDGSGKDFWDLALMPTHRGKANAVLYTETLRILASTENPEVAFEVLTWLVTEGAPDLIASYEAIPADGAETDALFASLDETYPQGVNWDVAVASMAYVNSPSHESNMPNFAEAQARIDEFGATILSDPELDIDDVVDALVEDLTAIFTQ